MLKQLGASSVSLTTAEYLVVASAGEDHVASVAAADEIGALAG